MIISGRGISTVGCGSIKPQTDFTHICNTAKHVSWLSWVSVTGARKSQSQHALPPCAVVFDIALFKNYLQSPKRTSFYVWNNCIKLCTGRTGSDGEEGGGGEVLCCSFMILPLS